MSFTDEEVLAFLDEAIDNEAWPELFGGAPDRTYHGLRMVAARNESSWMVLFERVETRFFETSPPKVYLFAPESEAYGFTRDAALGLSGETFEAVSGLEAAEARGPFAIGGIEVVGPRGSLALEDAMVMSMDLRPGASTAAGADNGRFALCLRAYLTRFPGAFFRDASDLLAHVDVRGLHVVISSEAFEHCVGPNGPETYPPAWRVKPSQSAVYRSLAQAIASDDASRFAPGSSNLDFRLHARATTGG